jgi:LGFP repeat
MTEVRGERNEFSGEAHGPVVQVGAAHGDIRFDLSPERIDLLSAHGLLPRLAKIPADEAAMKLAMVDPRKAAEVIEMMPEARRIAIIPYMDSASATEILSRLPDEIAATLHLAIRAARSISSDAAKWHHLLGDASGDLCREVRSKRSPAGFSSRYDRGTVYWNERTGTGMTAGAIEKRYRELGGVSEGPGYPIGSETQAATSHFGTVGAFQRFESNWDYEDVAAIENIVTVCGATLYASEKGVFATWGGIGEYYEASGGTRGPLGFPLSGNMWAFGSRDNPTNEYRQEFEGGVVYWSDPTGAACVLPPIGEEHERNLLEYGLPIGDQQIAAESEQGTTGVFQRFQGGRGNPDTASASIYSSTSHGTWPVSGTIMRSFHRSGGTAGPYGFPMTSEGPTGLEDAFDTYEQHFESGVLMRSGNKFVGVAGKVYRTWCEHRDELGLPISPERTLGDGPDLVQFFDRGVISVVDGAAQLWLAPSAD